MATRYTGGSTIYCREATPADIDSLIRLTLYLALKTEALSLNPQDVRAGYELLFTLPFPWLPAFVACDEQDSVVGAIVLGGIELSEWRGKIRALITSLCVGPGHEARGIGTLLYSTARKRLQEDTRITGIRLYADTSNPVIEPFYVKRVGMRPNEHYRILDDEWAAPPPEPQPHPSVPQSSDLRDIESDLGGR